MKEKILQKSVNMFLSYGFKSVTMDDIASEMGVSKKTIYKYFTNKETLVDQSTLVLQEKIDGILNDIIQKKHNAIEENFVIKNVFIEMFKKAKTSPMFQLKKYYPESFNKLMEKEFCTFSKCVKSNLERGVEEKLYRSDIDKELVMKFYFTLVLGIYENEMFGTQISKIIKTELKILEYHTRAIATLYGITVLENQLTKFNKTTH